MAKNLIYILLSLILASFVLFDSYAWGKYIVLMLTLIIAIIGIVINNWKIKLRFDMFFMINTIFISYVALSSIWAIRPTEAITMASSLLRVFVCSYIIYITFCSLDDINIEKILKAIMWSGYIVAVYSLIFYGLDSIISSGKSLGIRLNNDFSNVNTIGMICSLSCTTYIYLFSKEKNNLLSLIFFVVSLIMVAASQSRKALVFLVIGVIGVITVRTRGNGRQSFEKVIKTLLAIILIVALIFFILNLDMFSGITNRMQKYANFLTGSGKVDRSTIVRDDMRQLGWRWFLKSPIAGIGFANSHVLSYEYLGYDTYLHDNFVELLCTGGVIGFALYYVNYLYLFVKLRKLKFGMSKHVNFFILWLFLMLLMNYGMVTYSSKLQNIYLMIHFLNVVALKREANLNDQRKESYKNIQEGSS